jgi:hypothetical protein
VLGNFWGLYAPVHGQKADSGQKFLDWQLGPLRLPRCDSIKRHFQLGSVPLWAWVCSILDRQDAINELIKCVLGG